MAGSSHTQHSASGMLLSASSGQLFWRLSILVLTSSRPMAAVHPPSTAMITPSTSAADEVEAVGAVHCGAPHGYVRSISACCSAACEWHA